MDLKVVAVLFCLSAFTISSSEAGIPGCCISARKNISPKVLMKVVGWTVQRSSGACDIDAVVLHFKDKRRRACVDLAVFKDLVKLGEEWMMKQKQSVKKRAAK